LVAGRFTVWIFIVDHALAKVSAEAAPADDGSQFDIATQPDQIARIVIENVGLARTRSIRSALTQAIDAAERKAHQKPKQAG
jgi:hypothetical protein